MFLRRARVLPIPCHATRKFSFLRFHRCRHLLFQVVVLLTGNFGTGTDWCENSTKWKSCKPVRAHGDGAWACLAHALQGVCATGARVAQPLYTQFVVLEVSLAPPCCFNSLFTGLVRLGLNFDDPYTLKLPVL